MKISTTAPILDGLVKRGLLQSFKLETIQKKSQFGHDRLTLVFPNGEALTIDTQCDDDFNCGIYIDNASTP